MTQVLYALDADYGDYVACILISAATVLSSYFTMWCVLSNCLAREKVSKVVKGDHIVTLLFLPIAKKYATEYKLTYSFHIMLYCIALVRIPCILLRVYVSMNGWYELQEGGWSFAYLMWNVLLLGLSMGQAAYWDFCNDSQSISGHQGRTLDEKAFGSVESISRLNRRKEWYQAQKECFVTMQASRSRRWRKKQLLQLACTAQMMQAWVWYLAKQNGYPSEVAKEQEISFLLGEWMQIQHWFEQEQINRTIERYTDCLIIQKPYLQDLDQIERKYFIASPKQKKFYFHRMHTCICNMVKRTFAVFNQWNEISYPAENRLRAMGQGIMQWTERYRQRSFDFSEKVQQETTEWVQTVIGDLKELGAL